MLIFIIGIDILVSFVANAILHRDYPAPYPSRPLIISANTTKPGKLVEVSKNLGGGERIPLGK